MVAFFTPQPDMGAELSTTDTTAWVGLRGTPKHGTRGRYARGCRCEVCRAPIREYSKEYRARNKRPRAVRSDKGVRKVPVAHGANAEYARGCRCTACRAAHTKVSCNCGDHERSRRRDYHRARRAIIAEADPLTLEYSETIEKDPCSYCGAPAGTVDHIVPLAFRGRHHWTNLTAACGRCNSSKGTQSLLAFLARIAATGGRHG